MAPASEHLPSPIASRLQGGDLRDALSGGGRAALQWHRGGKGVAMDIARGLASLHANSVIHRDIKSKNVLLAGGGALVAKLADVGLAAIHTHGYLTPKPDSPHVTGTLAWSAPELLMGGRCAAAAAAATGVAVSASHCASTYRCGQCSTRRCNDKVDIYSLGIVLWEIATGDVPRRGFTAPPPPSERCPEVGGSPRLPAAAIAATAPTSAACAYQLRRTLMRCILVTVACRAGAGGADHGLLQYRPRQEAHRTGGGQPAGCCGGGKRGAQRGRC